MKPQNSLLKKTILLFISIFLPISLLSILMLNVTNRRLKNQVFSSINMNNSSYISQLESSLNNAYISDYNQITQSNFRSFSVNSSQLAPYEKSAQVKLIIDQLSDVSLISPFVESTHVYFKNSATAYHSPGYPLGSFHHISPDELQTLQQLKEEHQLLHYYLNPLTGEWTLAFFVFPVTSPDYCSTVELSQDKIQLYLEANKTYEGERYVLQCKGGYTLTDLEPELQEEILRLQESQDSEFPEGNTYTTVTLDDTDYYLFSCEASGISAVYLRLIPTDSLLSAIEIAPFLYVVAFGLIAAACILFFIGMYRMLHRPMQLLTDAFEEVEQGNFKITLDDSQSKDFSYLYQAFNHMTSQLDTLVEKGYHQKLLLQKAELKQLQAQINPHFLYNSFFMLQRMIKLGLNEESQEMANALAVYFRYLTRNSMDLVTLTEEYSHAQTYAYIQGLRFEGRIQVIFDPLPDAFSELPVPKLILQPLLENAFKYGLHNKMEDGLLEIHFTCTDDTLTIIVEENGDDLTDDALQSLTEKLKTAGTDSTTMEMSGLLNIQRRLVIFSDYHDFIQVTRSPLGGLRVSVTLRK